MSSSPAQSAQEVAHNEADVEFAQMMIVHHEGALAMAAMVADRTESPALRALAERIAAAQGPEIDTMTAWLASWGAERPAGGGMHPMGHGDTMPGMMTDEQMSALGAGTGPEFDAMFLTMMIEHHEGAITMSQDELAEGTHPGALDLATLIIDAQTAEIAQMRAMFGG